MDTFPLQALLLEKYGLNLSLSPLPGEVDLNYKASDSKGNCFVLKVAAQQRTEAEINFQVDLLEHVAGCAIGFDTPTVIRTLSNEAYFNTEHEGERIIVHLLSWVDGNPLRTVATRNSTVLTDWGTLCGRLSKSLSSYDHPSAHRFYRWDPQHTLVARKYLPFIEGQQDRELAENLFDRFEATTQPKLAQLRCSVNYNDAHEDNLLVKKQDYQARIVGLVDVGDAVYTQTINELAIACAYAAMDCTDPIAAICHLVAGYHHQFQIYESELEVLLGLIIGRLLLTVTSAAEARAIDPQNSYRSISEQQAWQLLRTISSISPDYAGARFRAACQLEPCRKKALFDKWISTQPVFQPIIRLKKTTTKAGFTTRKATFTPFDFSVGSKSLGHYSNYIDLDTFDKTITQLQGDFDYGYGGYLETRPFYTTDLFQQQGNEGPRWRTVHLGLDLWSPAGCEVYAPLAGKIHSFRQNSGARDYGATLILEHSINIDFSKENAAKTFTFFTLYGHLSTESIADKVIGAEIQAGELIATTGSQAENGGWPPHLHFQVMLEMLGNKGDFPGVAFPEEQVTWASLCPNPSLLAGLPLLAEANKTAETTEAEIATKRARFLGRSLSLSYAKPLHMVRGMGAYLLDNTGRRYLDTVNNVAHVGHEHPEVVLAIQQQAAVLNTNTRYLHDEIVAFAEEICATLPQSLKVVHVVNSGSEANELALRMAYAATGQRDMLAVEVGYHGNTNAVIDVSSYKFDGKGGHGAPSTTHVIPIPDVFRGKHRNPDTAGIDYTNYLDSIITKLHAEGKKPAAFICESILSCGGQVVLPKGYLKEAYAKTRAAGAICIADEVQVGLGRVGTHFWGFETQKVVPDIVVIGKPIGNGHPLGVVVCTAAIADAFAATGMEYFNTFGGNPVSCAAGRAVLKIVQQQGLQQHALAIGNFLTNELKTLQDKYVTIGDVRGQGLFLGIELVKDPSSLEPAGKLASHLANEARKRGLLLSTDGPYHNVIKLKPPMVITKKEAAFVVSTIDAILATT